MYPLLGSNCVACCYRQPNHLTVILMSPYESLGVGNVYSMNSIFPQMFILPVTKEIWIFRWYLDNRILNN